MRTTLDRLIGGHPAFVFLRLAVISLIVGVILSVFGVDPYAIWAGFRDLVVNLYEMGFEAIDLIFRYILIGAVIVVPVWFVIRLISMRGEKT